MTDLETKLIGLLELKFGSMLIDYPTGKFHKNCELEHLAEMVKLAHQIRSLEEKGAV